MGSLDLNGEAWKNRNNTTYTSLLDRYSVADLFSDESMELYQKMEEENRAEHQKLTEYVFSGQLQAKDEEENMIDCIFSQELQFSKLRDYNKNEDDYSICYVMAEILFVLVFICALMKIKAGRKKRREADAVEINLEN